MTNATGSVSAAEFDPFSAAAVTDPYSWYAALHAGPRVLHQERWDLWVVSRHADVRAALRDHRMSSADGVTFLRAPLPMMLTQDPPNHERLRRIAGREFAPRDVHRFRPKIEELVAEGLDELASSSDGDIVTSIAIPVPIRLMAAILGVPEADIPDLRRMANDLVQGFALAPDGSQAVESAFAAFDLTLITQAIMDIHGYFAGIVAQRRVSRTDDLVTKLMYPPSGEELSEDELLWFCLLLLVAGIETTTNLIGNMTVAFLDHPEQWELLRSRPELVASAVNEALRYDAPIQGFFRTAREACEIGDVEIPADARVLVAFGAANRDPLHYDDPDDFRIERDPTDHMAFGAGIHRCLGAGLAELEGRVVLEQLLERTPTLEAAGSIVRTTNPTLRGAKSVPLSTSGWRR